MEMDIRERLIIRTDGCLKQPFPKAAAFRPTRLQVSRLLEGDAIYSRGSHLNEGGRDRRGHSKDQIERARRRSADRQGIHQDLANKQCGALGLRRVRDLREQRSGSPLACALPPLGALKIQVDEGGLASAPARSHARAGYHLRPQRRKRLVGPCRGAVSAAKSAMQRVVQLTQFLVARALFVWPTLAARS